MQPQASDDRHAHRAEAARVDDAVRGRAPRARCPRSSLVLGALVLAAVVSTHWVRLNLSSSVPLGVYRLERLAPPLQRGTLVVLSAPARIRPWWHSFASLLKPVAAVAGEEVCGVEGALVIHGEAYGPISTEADGKLLPHLMAVGRAQGTVFWPVHSPKAWTAPFGMTPTSTLTAQAVPLWIWR
jgi:type IV secretory pathway protease TraF